MIESSTSIDQATDVITSTFVSVKITSFQRNQ